MLNGNCRTCSVKMALIFILLHTIKTNDIQISTLKRIKELKENYPSDCLFELSDDEIVKVEALILQINGETVKIETNLNLLEVHAFFMFTNISDEAIFKIETDVSFLIAMYDKKINKELLEKIENLILGGVNYFIKEINLLKTEKNLEKLKILFKKYKRTMNILTKLSDFMNKNGICFFVKDKGITDLKTNLNHEFGAIGDQIISKNSVYYLQFNEIMHCRIDIPRCEINFLEKINESNEKIKRLKERFVLEVCLENEGIPLYEYEFLKYLIKNNSEIDKFNILYKPFNDLKAEAMDLCHILKIGVGMALIVDKIIELIQDLKKTKDKNIKIIFHIHVYLLIFNILFGNMLEIKIMKEFDLCLLNKILWILDEIMEYLDEVRKWHFKKHLKGDGKPPNTYKSYFKDEYEKKV